MAGESDISKILLEAEKARIARIEAEAIDFEFPDWTQCDQDTYDRSVLPKEALKRFPFETELAITQLQRELQYDRVQAVCHEAIVFDEDKGFRYPLAVLHNWHWWRQMPPADDDFWQTGYLEIVVPKKIGGMRFEARGRVRYFGVRFWPDGLPGGADNPLPAQSSADAQPLPQLPQADLERAAQAVITIWGNSVNEAKAWQIAKGMFPENRVSREPFLEHFRAIRGAKRPGKPSSRD